MKAVLLSGMMLLGASAVNAQISSTTGISSTPVKKDSLESIGDALADIAIENIGTGVEEATANAALYQYKLSKTAWLDHFSAAGNLNEFTIHGRNSLITPYGYSTVYPRYNLGVAIPLGIFVNQPKQIKSQYYTYKAQEENLRRVKENYRLQVLAAYYNYMKNIELMAIQGEALQDAEFAYKKTEEQFSKGEATLELYTLSSKRYNSELVNKTTLETDIRVAKAQLEALLGMSYEEAMAKVKNTKSSIKRK